MTLVELTAALFVLTIGLLGAIQTFHFGTDKIQYLRERAIAGRIIQNEIETLRAKPFAELADREKAPFVSTNPELEMLVNATPGVTVKPSGEPALHLKEVAVSLRWTGDSGRTLERAATTLITEK